MKKFLKISAIVVGMALCVLAVFLWRDPTVLLMFAGAEKEIVAKVSEQNLSEGQVNRELLRSRIDLATKSLKSKQKGNNWEGHPGITAITLRAILKSPDGENLKNQAFVQEGLEYLIFLQGDDGSFYIPFSVGQGMKNYTTALSVLALNAADSEKFSQNIKKAQTYLASIQKSGENGYVEGGVGYTESGAPDINNVQLNIEALKESGYDKTHPEYFQKALIYLKNCQDSEVNEQEWAGGSGGFNYSERHTDENGKPLISGGVTFQGLKSLLFCDVKADDPRILAVNKWVSKNFAVDSHPGKGQISIYYYYSSMAQALSLAKTDFIERGDGQKIDWKRALAVEILNRQRKDGSWINSNRKYMEGVSVMASAYAISALNHIYRDWKE